MMDLDEFSDDGLDDLPDNALQELEHHAIQSTQAQLKANIPQKVSSQGGGAKYTEYILIEDDDLDTAEVTNEVGVPVGRPVVDNTLQQQQKQQQQQQQEESRRSIPPPVNPRWNPTIDPSKRQPPSLAVRPHQPNAGAASQHVFGSQRFEPPSSNLSRAQASQFVRPPIPPNRFAPSQSVQSHPGDVLSALQQRVRTLEAELNAARGEVSIIRSNSTKAQQQHEEEVARLRKLNAEQTSKQERIVEAAVAAERSAHNQLEFLEIDLREVSDRARRRDAGGAATVGTTTPKKGAKQWRSVADGFDEMDIVVSPNKGQGRARHAGPVAANVGERTPSKGKRKRPTVDSPIMALETHTDDVAVHSDTSNKPEAPGPQRRIAEPDLVLPFEFLPLVLDHSCFPDQPPTFETFSRFAFPSEPNTSMSAIIFQMLPMMGKPGSVQQLVDFAEYMSILWTRCCDEQYWEPIKYLISLISFTFSLQSSDVGPYIVSKLVPLIQRTVYSLAEWRHRLLEADLTRNEQYRLLYEHIDTTEALTLLHATALTCSMSMEATEPGLDTKAVQFWKLINLDTVFIFLTPKQKLSDIFAMLELLTTSALPNSIGPITEEKDPPFVARMIIERVAAKLTEFPRSATTPAQKRRVRLAALRTLIAFAKFPFGAIQLASHSTALPRLVTCLSSCIDDLYDPTLINANLGPATEDTDESHGTELPNAELCRIISQCVLLIHTLVTGPSTANIADIGQKLSTFHGGSQRYLLALGRLNFAEEDLVMEAGIDGDTVEAAHELLEMAVTPDEGEIISEAFGA